PGRHAGRVAGPRWSLRRSGPGGERAAPTPGQDPPARHPPARRRRRSFELPAYYDRRNPDCWLRVGHWGALPVLSAGSGGVAEIVPDHVDLAHQLGALADERRATQRFGELPVADAAALGDLEGEA